MDEKIDVSSAPKIMSTNKIKTKTFAYLYKK